MTEHEEPRADGATETTSRAEGSRSWWPVLAPAAAFLAGLLLGGLLIGVVSDDDGTPAADPESGASTSADGSSASPSEGDTTIVVPEECLEAVDSVEQALDLADRSAGAVRDFQPEELRSLLRELEGLDQQARAQVEACRQVEADSQ